MEKKAYAYTVINVFVLLAAAVFFFSNYRPGDMFQGVEASFVGILIVTVMIVHCLKAIRLYFALYGGGLSFSRYLKIYCKATPVSIIFPFKTGELFRMYCYGMQTGDMLKGVITVVLDRFMDTIALLTMIIGINAICGGVIAPFVYGLIVFAVVLLLMYMAFPGCITIGSNTFSGRTLLPGESRYLKYWIILIMYIRKLEMLQGEEELSCMDYR